MRWFNSLPQGAKVLVLFLVVVVASAIFLRGGTIIGEALADTSYADEGE